MTGYRFIEGTGSNIAYYLTRKDEPTKAIKTLEPLILAANRNRCHRSLISLCLLMVLAYFKQNKYKQALSKLNEAVALAIFEGFKRPFLEYGKAQKPILEMALVDNHLFPINRLKRSFLMELINMIEQEDRKRERHSPGLLTSREQEVAEYVSDGNSNKEIARICNCSENTVKFHLKNIFSKLGVKNRKALARTAWENNR